ncbi:MAG: GntR family transcriptional regulator [Anaerolineales bacterium]|nr:GntR family transcriptional regulator [Anaerolineales bacterium]
MAVKPAVSSRQSDQYLRTQLALGQLLESTAPGTFLPSEPQLAKHLRVSRATLREAMRPFEEEGRIVRRQGVGTVVTRKPRVLESGLEVLESIDSMAARIGLEVRVGSLSVRPADPDPGECEQMGLAPGEGLTEISRGILAGGRPVAFLIDRVPAAVLQPHELGADFGGSVLDLFLERKAPPLDYSRTEISAVSASHAVARELRIQRGDVLLHLEAYLYSPSGTAVDHSQSYFLPGTFCFHVVRRLSRQG